jgi:hypothetical protein
MPQIEQLPGQQRYALTNLRLGEVSLVTAGANTSAKVTLYKGAEKMKMTPTQKAMYSTLSAAATVAVNAAFAKGLDVDDVLAVATAAAPTGDDAEVAKLQKDCADLLAARDTALETANAVTKSAEAAGFTVTGEGAETKVTKAATEYVDIGGKRIAKGSVDDSTFELLKQQHADIALLKKNAESARLAKAASDAWPNLAGSAEHKANLFGAVEKMDDDAKAAAMTMLAAADAAVAKSMDELGTSQVTDPASAEAKLDALAKAHAAANNESYAVAYAEVVKTGEGRELYAAHKAELRAARSAA